MNAPTAADLANLLPPSQNGGRDVSVSTDPLERCKALLARMPPMEAPMKFKRSWSIQEALDQHAGLTKQAENLVEIGRQRCTVRRTQVAFAELRVQDALKEAKEAVSQAATKETARTLS